MCHIDFSEALYFKGLQLDVNDKDHTSERHIKVTKFTDIFFYQLKRGS